MAQGSYAAYLSMPISKLNTAFRFFGSLPNNLSHNWNAGEVVDIKQKTWHVATFVLLIKYYCSFLFSLLKLTEIHSGLISGSCDLKRNMKSTLTLLLSNNLNRILQSMYGLKSKLVN